jgi:DNA invertase Pin-like site-specific DNA recombinase
MGQQKKKAFGYVRVSSMGQVDGDGFNRQEQVIKAYADKHGIEVVEIFREEGISGTTDEADRPAFQEMVGAILKNGVSTVIIEGLDRLAREYRIQETLLVYLASKGIELISARTDENVTEAVMSDPMKKALVQIQGVFAELEKNLLVKKLRSARASKKAASGKCEGRKGYRDSGTEAVTVVQEIKRLRRKRNGMKQPTYQQIAGILNESGRTTLDGRPFTAKNVAALAYRHGGKK